MKEYTYEECQIGKKESFSVTITQEMLEMFKTVSGDYNPLHNEVSYATEKGFDGRVVYGMLTASFLSTLAGMYLPGKYCLIQEVNTKFAKPVYVNDVLTVTGEVIERNDLFQQLVLKILILNQCKETVVRAKMKVGVLNKEEV